MTMSRRWWVLGVVLVLAAAASGVWFYAQSRGSTPKFRMAKIERGPITASVSATGTLNAVVTVQVGSQVSGQIKELFADFNSQVKAQLEAAKANVHNQKSCSVATSLSDCLPLGFAFIVSVVIKKAQVAVL